MFSAEKSDPIPIQPEFWGVSRGLNCPCCGTEVRKPQANYSCNYFRTDPTHTLKVHQRPGQTGRQTDMTDDLRQQYRALHYVHRAVKLSLKP